MVVGHYETEANAICRGELITHPAVREGFPSCPRTSITASVAQRRNILVMVYDALAESVAEHEAQDPSYRPWRVRTSGYTQVPTQGTPAYEAWVGNMDQALAAYTASLPVGGRWDLSLGSAAALEEVLLARYPNLASWEAASQADQEGSVRYLGEVLRRAVDGIWDVTPGPLRDDNPYAGRPLVQIGAGHDSYAVSPHMLIEVMVSTRERGQLDPHVRSWTEASAR